MSDRETQTSGELSSFLHLTGWRPVILALVAGIAGAIGMYVALGEPAQWVSRYVVNGQRVADDDFTPAELDIFVEEIALSTRLPGVIAAVEEATGLENEEDYEITAGQAPASIGLIDIRVITDSPENAQAVAVETGIAAVRVALVGQRTGLESARDQIQGALATADARVSELTREAGGVNPTTAYNRAAALLLDRQDFLANRPTVTVTDDDGNTITRPAPEPDGPSLAELQSEVDRLEPIEREYRQLSAEIDELSLRLSDRNDSIREASGAIAALDAERTDPFVISEVETEEASRISSLLTGVLLFAVPAALVTILAFVVYDMIRGKPEPFIPAQPLDGYGVLDAASHRALPPASITNLVVVDREGTASPSAQPAERDIMHDEAIEREMREDRMGTAGIYDVDDEGDDEGPKPKSSRWGRDASSKAG